MYCDGHRNTLVMDEDGSLLGDNAAFGTILPENEIGWFKKLAYVDPLNRDILEDLVPFTHQWLPNGTKLTPMRGKLTTSQATSKWVVERRFRGRLGFVPNTGTGK